jgi:biopolymer transport protein TolQ
MVQFVLVLLLLFSVFSWAIIFNKYRIIKRVEDENKSFLELYMRSNRLSEIYAEARKFKNSSIAEVFRAGYSELGKSAKSSRATDPSPADSIPSEFRAIDNLERALNRAVGTESTRIESTLGFLATTGSASPFIGLFGTVWGIMHAFRGIGARGSASLAVVAPGISEALIATAAGLAAAIPAVIFYNYYQNRLKKMTMEMENFASEFLNIIERYQTKA